MPGLTPLSTVASPPSSPEPLDPASVLPDPIDQFRRWYSEAQAAGSAPPEAVTVPAEPIDRVVSSV